MVKIIIEDLKIWVCGNVCDLFSRDRVGLISVQNVKMEICILVLEAVEYMDFL